jgi:hypothetical protein
MRNDHALNVITKGHHAAAVCQVPDTVTPMTDGSDEPALAARPRRPSGIMSARAYA